MNKRWIWILWILPSLVMAGGGKAVTLKDADIPLNEETFRAGFKVYKMRCQTCHGLKYIKFRHLRDIGVSKQDIDAYRGKNDMNSPLVSMLNDAALKASFGKIPPDLSLMARARKGEEHYIYTVLTSYSLDEKQNIVNTAFPGIAMPDPFGYASIKDKAPIEKEVAQVASFLAWAADPHMLSRERMGYWVIGYLIIFTFLMYLMKRRIWGRLDKETS